MMDDERSELEALRERVATLENLMAHRAGISIVLYNGLLQASSLMMDVSRVTTPVPFRPLHPGDAESREELGHRVTDEMKQLSDLFKDRFSRLEPMRDLLAETD